MTNKEGFLKQIDAIEAGIKDIRERKKNGQIFQKENGKTFRELWEEFTLRELREVFTINELREIFALSELREIFTIRELREPFTLRDLRDWAEELDD